HGAELVAMEAPPSGAAGERPAAWIDLRNTGTTTWSPATTFLGTTDPMDHDSPFYDAESWASPRRPAAVHRETRPGEIGRFGFALKLPAVARDAVIVDTFGLVEEGVRWFGPQDLRVEVLVAGTGDPADGPDEDPGGGPAGPSADPESDHHDAVVGGCRTAGG